jgi:hypothetical protein
VLATTPNSLGDLLPAGDEIDDDVVAPRADAELIYGWSDYPAGSAVLAWDDDPHASHGNLVYISFDYRGVNPVERVRLLENVIVYLVNRDELATGPPPVPGGEATTAPLRASRLSPAGDQLEVEWDAASCPAAGYNLLYGDLVEVASVTLNGSVCAIGASGLYDWDAVPAGDLFFLIVGTDGTAVESSWGEGTLGERNDLTPSGECGVTAKDISTVCR